MRWCKLTKKTTLYAKFLFSCCVSSYFKQIHFLLGAIRCKRMVVCFQYFVNHLNRGTGTEGQGEIYRDRGMGTWKREMDRDKDRNRCTVHEVV